MSKNVPLHHVHMFINFAAKHLKLKTLPKINLVGSSENKKNAFGHFVHRTINVRITDRHPIDVMRTIAHELIHYKQRIEGVRYSEQMKEDEANALAGRIMRDFDTAHPEVFKDKTIKANMMEDGVAANAIGGGAIAKFDPILGTMQKRKPLNNKKIKIIQELLGSIEKRKSPQELLGDRVDSMKKESQSVGKNPNPLNNTFDNGNTEMNKGGLDSIRDSFEKNKEKELREPPKPLRDITKDTNQ